MTKQINPERKYILAIDPGTEHSGFVFCKYDWMNPIEFGLLQNEDMVKKIPEIYEMTKNSGGVYIVIEKIACYGMPIGSETLDTVEWIGEFKRRAKDVSGEPPLLIFRRTEKIMICNNSRANDATIRQALIDRFAYGVRNGGKGTKKEPGFFYGFKADIWQAFAVAYTAKLLMEEERDVERD